MEPVGGIAEHIEGHEHLTHLEMHVKSGVPLGVFAQQQSEDSNK